jgi:hypothetical protein
MPFTTVPDKATGAVFTEANWDTDIAANLNTGLVVPTARVMASGLSQVDFSSIPGGYAAILLTGYARSTQAVTAAAMNMRLNGDTGATYDRCYMGADGSVEDNAEAFAITAGPFASVPGASSPADSYGGGWMLMPAYDQTDRHKSWTCMSYWKRTNVAAGQTCRFEAGFWRNLAAVTSVSPFIPAGTFAAESVFNLYVLTTV